MQESYDKLQQKPKTLPESKDALQLIWSALPEKSTINTVKDFCKWTFSTQNVIIHITDINSYI